MEQNHFQKFFGKTVTLMQFPDATTATLEGQVTIRHCGGKGFNVYSGKRLIATSTDRCGAECVKCATSILQDLIIVLRDKRDQSVGELL